MTYKGYKVEVTPLGVSVWREGDEIRSLYMPGIPGYWHWRAIAERQVLVNKDAAAVSTAA